MCALVRRGYPEANVRVRRAAHLPCGDLSSAVHIWFQLKKKKTPQVGEMLRSPSVGVWGGCGIAWRKKEGCAVVVFLVFFVGFYVYGETSTR